VLTIVDSGREVFGEVALALVWRARVLLMWELIRVLLRLHTGSSTVLKSISSKGSSLSAIVSCYYEPRGVNLFHVFILDAM
jgi:hypothetical protein